VVIPEHARSARVQYELPRTEDVSITCDIPYKEGAGSDLLMDVYAPPDVGPAHGRPAVVFIHGGPLPDRPMWIKDHGAFRTWGPLVAARGYVGAVFNHRHLERWTTARDSLADIDDAIAFLRRHAGTFGLNPERICIFTFSAGPPLALRTVLRDRPPYVRCAIAYYGMMDIDGLRSRTDGPPISGDVVDDLCLRRYLSSAPDTVPPLFLARAGRDHPALNATIDRFVAEALTSNVPLTLVTHPDGQHAFDTRDDLPRTREVIRATLDFIDAHLRAAPHP